MNLRHCQNCESLPTLGQLPFLKDLAKTHSQASLRWHVVISKEVQEITSLSYSAFTSNKFTVGSSSREIEEIAHEERMETEFTPNRLPPNSASFDTITYEPN